jgi:hypothetical protein
MAFVSKRIDKIGHDSIIEEINEDYHNGECIILQPLNELDEIKENINYIVVDYNDFLIQIYPSQFQKI